MRNYYDLLSVAADAPADEIKRAFRREIARYHPDKVQHLGREFQDMASGIAADLTEAYRILMNPALRAKYDEDLTNGATAPKARQTPAPSATTPDQPATSPFQPAGAQAPLRPSSTAGIDFVKKATLSRLREAVGDVFGSGETLHVGGFDIAVASKPKRGLFKKADDKVRLLIRFVPFVDAQAVADAWSAAAKAGASEAVLCVLLMGAGMAPATDLAAAVNEQRRKSRHAGPVLVPVDVRDWEALFPPETPASVRVVIQRLKEEKR